MTRARLFLVVFLAIAPLSCPVVGTALAQEDPSHESEDKGFAPHLTPVDEICGPRCVTFVLQHYGEEADVIDLTREMQYPNLRKGAALSTVAAALENRGVYVYPMRLSPNARLKWPHPVIVHLDGNGATDGHYVVWLPESTAETIDVWNGVEGMQRIPENRFFAECSGAVLLTAPHPIDNPDAAVERSTRSMAVITATVALGGTAVLLVFAAWAVPCRRNVVPSFWRTGLCSKVD